MIFTVSTVHHARLPLARVRVAARHAKLQQPYSLLVELTDGDGGEHGGVDGGGEQVPLNVKASEPICDMPKLHVSADCPLPRDDLEDEQSEGEDTSFSLVALPL